VQRFLILALGVLTASPAAADDARLVRSARSGRWSAPSTWQGAQPPGAGARVQVRSGHTVIYDVRSTALIRSIHVAGTLTFARDRDTLLTVGLIKIQPGDDASEDGFNCDAHVRPAAPTASIPALEVGSADEPIPAGRAAVIRLALAKGLDRESCPAIVCCGGRLDLHGAPLDRTWVKLGATAEAGDARVRLASPVKGWRVGDRVIVTTTGSRDRINTRVSLRPGTAPPGNRQPAPAQTEERTITAVEGDRLTLDRRLALRHQGEGDYRGEVANLSRNVVIESADPRGVRGHTMVHRHSFAAIGYAEFRHLGKEGQLGKYPIHFHLCGATARGSSVIGASVHDSHNRWVTIHGTQYLVVGDCVGYQSVGHGYFLEDGTEVFNVLDRNLGVQAFGGKPLPRQELPYDQNDGSAFWWANSLNTFTRNVAVECDRWGFRFEAAPTRGFDLCRPVPQPDGTVEKVDIRTLPFVRFEGNEAHDQLTGINLGGAPGDFFEPGVGGVWPSPGEPLLLRNTRIWNTQWAFAPHTRHTVDNLDIADSAYGVFTPAHNAIVRQTKDPEWGRLTIRRTEVPFRMPEKLVADIPDYLYPPFDLVTFAGDHLPPTTVITHVRRQADRLLVQGTAADDRAIRRVTVNGQAARALTPNFAEWEIDLPVAADGRLAAQAEDAVGNVEPVPHTVLAGPGSRFRTITVRREDRARVVPAALSAAGKTPTGLDGLWRVESQQQAGRKTERSLNMVMKVTGKSILLYTASKSAGDGKLVLRRTGLPITCGLYPGSAPPAIDLDGPLRGTSRGLYRLDGDTLTLCLSPSLSLMPNYEHNDTAGEILLNKTVEAVQAVFPRRPARISREAGTLIVLRRVP
jgi:uncharacterized protein (TIGR03067 family)